MSKRPVGVIVYDDFENPTKPHEPTVVDPDKKRYRVKPRSEASSTTK